MGARFSLTHFRSAASTLHSVLASVRTSTAERLHLNGQTGVSLGGPPSALADACRVVFRLDFRILRSLPILKTPCVSETSKTDTNGRVWVRSEPVQIDLNP